MMTALKIRQNSVSMSQGPTKGEIAKARHFAPPLLTLRGQAVSPEAKALVVHCLNELVLASLPPQQRRPTSLPAIERATEGMLAGLILAIGDGWTVRPMSSDSFTSEGVNVAQFRKVHRAFVAAGLLEEAPGFYDRSGPIARGATTRLRLSKSGSDLAAYFGVSGDLAHHFRVDTVSATAIDAQA